MERAWTEQMEKYSSAVTLSDMEIFVFPELLLAGALSNIMSPLIWQWREDPWFQGIEKLSEYRRILKVKQYIIDHFVFNLDLDTWGLTTKDRELARFSPYISISDLRASNGLFGYEGDRYYFDMDIRRHFHLDQYNDDVIPYWKTETVEAMTAFCRRPGFQGGAGECVSFSLLYYAALWILADIPLERIYMLATPLHSQNFVAAGGGLLTNNRRIVTKNMWFNGTETSFKARRALQNEKVTMVANSQGYVHMLYPEATMSEENYRIFADSIRSFLLPPLDLDMLYGFLREHPQWQAFFQCKGANGYVAIEQIYAIEEQNAAKVSIQGADSLVAQVEATHFSVDPLPDRVLVKELAQLLKGKMSFGNTHSWAELFAPFFPFFTPEKLQEFSAAFASFCYIDPRLPAMDKNWQPQEPLDLTQCKSREDVIAYMQSIREHNGIADLAFMAYRDVSGQRWQPFLKAALERNPVTVEACKKLTAGQVYQTLLQMDNQSIYSENRLAQPDEVWNFQTGDGIEKALALWDVLESRQRLGNGRLLLTENNVRLEYDGVVYEFSSHKGFAPACWDMQFNATRQLAVAN